MPRDIVVIRPFYDSHHFRSAEEAHWAVFWNAAGIRYEYEQDGYKLGNGDWYQPDFFVSAGDGSQMLVEVKGSDSLVTDEEITKASALAEGLGMPWQIVTSDTRFEQLRFDVRNTDADGFPAPLNRASTLCQQLGMTRREWAWAMNRANEVHFGGGPEKPPSLADFDKVRDRFRGV